MFRMICEEPKSIMTASRTVQPPLKAEGIGCKVVGSLEPCLASILCVVKTVLLSYLLENVPFCNVELTSHIKAPTPGRRLKHYGNSCRRGVFGMK